MESAAGQTRSQHTAQSGRHRPPHNAGHLAGIDRWTNTRATVRKVTGIGQGDANGDSVIGDGVIPRKRFAKGQRWRRSAR